MGYRIPAVPELGELPYYFENNHPVRDQFIQSRRAFVRVILIHTAESVLDVVGPDTGAENVAAFIRSRSDAGSYQSIVDSDSIVDLGPPSWEFFHCRGGVNRWANGVSFACKSTDWPAMLPAKREAMLRNGARSTARHILWIETGQVWKWYPAGKARGTKWFPIRWITKAEADRGDAGITAHGAMDPTRRTDPGATFPRDPFLAMVQYEYDLLWAQIEGPAEPTEPGEQMSERVYSLTDDLGVVIERVDQLYELYRGAPPAWSMEEAGYWKSVAAEKLAGGESPENVFRNLRVALAAEPKGV